MTAVVLLVAINGTPSNREAKMIARTGQTVQSIVTDQNIIKDVRSVSTAVSIYVPTFKQNFLDADMQFNLPWTRVSK